MSGKWRLVKGTELYDIRLDPGQEKDIANEHPDRVTVLREWYEDWWAELEPTFSRTSSVYVGSPETPELKITALQWIDQAPPWNQGIIRRSRLKNGRAGNRRVAPVGKFTGHWAVDVARDGVYAFEVRRWPEESGLKIREGVPALARTPGCLPSYSAVDGTALPIGSATLRINGEDLETIVVSDNDDSIRFTRELTKGSYKFSPYFSINTEHQETELGCYYLCVTFLNP